MIALLLAAALGASGPDEVVARVDGTPITSGALARSSAASAARGVPASPGDILDRLVSETVLAAEARRLKLAGSPEVVAHMEYLRRRAAVDSFVEKEISARVEVGEKSLLEMFHASSDFASFDLLVFEKREAAQTAVERIRKGGAFASEAGAAVLSNVYPKPSDAPATMRAQIQPPLAEALFAAARGSVVGPVKLAEGWAVARLLSKEIGTGASFAEHRASLERRARERGTKEMVKHVAAQLRAKGGVTLDEAFLQKVGAGPATRQQLEHVISTVDGRPLRYEDIYGSVSSLRGGHGMGAAVRIEIAWKEIENRLLQGLAVQRGHDKAPSVVSQEGEFERTALAFALVRKIESATPPPSEDEIQASYRRNAGAYGRPFAQVLPEVASAAANEKRAAAVNARIRQLRSKASISIDRNALARAGRKSP